MENPILPPPLPNDGQLSSPRLSFGNIISSAVNCWQRFPVTICYLGFMVFVIWLKIWGKEPPSALGYFAMVGPLLSLSIYLWCERYENNTLTTRIQWIANSLLIADLIYLLCVDKADTALIVGHSVVSVALAVAIVFVPSTRGATTTWMFSYRQVISLVIADLISVAVSIALLIMYVAFGMLLDIWPGKIALSGWTVLAVAIPAVVFMARIPAYNDESLQELTVSKLFTGLGKYLFLPLLVVYFAILYFYACKILFTWELPQGYVSWSVTALVIEVLAVQYMLYPARKSMTGRFRTFITLVVPGATIPLLVLMSVAIGYRINQYGITPERLYVATFNIWCYVAMTGLLIDRARRINWIPLSFAAVMVAVSIIPVANFITIGNHFSKDKENPLHSTIDETSAADIVVVDTVTMAEEAIVEVKNFDEPIYAASPLKKITIPDGCRRMSVFEYDNSVPQSYDGGPIEISDGDVSATLDIDSVCRLYSNISLTPFTLAVNGNPQASVVVTEVYPVTTIYKDHTRRLTRLKVKGYLFEK